MVSGQNQVESILFVEKRRKTLNSAFVHFTDEDRERENTLQQRNELKQLLAEEDKEMKRKRGKGKGKQHRVRRSRFATADGESFKRRTFVEEDLRAGGTITLFTKGMLKEEIMKRKRMIKGKKAASIAQGISYDNIICFICNKGDNDDDMILCDRCNDGYHLYCLEPPLEEIPEGEWLCVICSRKSLKIGEKVNLPEGRSKCEDDSSGSESKEAHQKHLCETCGFATRTRPGLLRHITRIHKNSSSSQTSSKLQSPTQTTVSQPI